MNVLLREIARSLTEIEMGFKGELTFSAAMEELVEDIRMSRVPGIWMKVRFSGIAYCLQQCFKPHLELL